MDENDASNVFNDLAQSLRPGLSSDQLRNTAHIPGTGQGSSHTLENNLNLASSFLRNPLPPVEAEPSAEPIERQAAVHRKAIAVHEKQMFTIARNRDVIVRSLQADLEEAQRVYDAECQRVARQIAGENASAAARLALRQQLRKSSLAALAILQPTEAERQAPMEERRVPARGS